MVRRGRLRAAGPYPGILRRSIGVYCEGMSRAGVPATEDRSDVW